MDGVLSGKILKITSYAHFVALLSLLIVTVLFTGSLFYFNFDSDAIVIFGIYWVVYSLPSLYLHMEYWLKNRGEEYELSASELIRRKRGEETVYKSEEIEEIVVYKSASLDKGGIPILGIESYYFARIYLKSGEELLLTCLLSVKLEQILRQLTGIKMERKKRLFNLLDRK
jgi:hypothetical protein